ncbi:hypothetical protein SAMN05444336_11082 [Albimonas donghaensis]|uniref:Uncharacterized protein n=1 Tax=Albimonas donghaensis TaxID=356660 RepID=A0A1H3EL24_9RHOB|nr:hypothetical protein [Albimonas donghaensis]SDX79493.1 hypothetical protein SAMN05444336_11082 [Albimonas donghaensis]
MIAAALALGLLGGARGLPGGGEAGQGFRLVSAAIAAPSAAALPREELVWLASDAEIAAWGGGDRTEIRNLLRKVRDRAPRIADDLQDYVRRRPGDPAAYAIAGLALLGEGVGDGAARSFDKAIELGGDPVWLGAATGAAFAVQGRPQAAAEAYDAALGKRPDLPLALRGRYRLAMAKGDVAAALDWAERLAAAAPAEEVELTPVDVDLAELYLRAGRPDDVIAQLSHAFGGDRTPRPEPLALRAAAPMIQAAQAAGLVRQAGLAMLVAERLLTAETRTDLPWPVLRARQARLEGRPEQAALLFGDLAAGTPALAAAFAPDRARAETEAGRPAVGLALLRDAWSDIGPADRASVLDIYAETAAAAGWPAGALDWLERRAEDLPAGQGAMLMARALLSADRAEAAIARARPYLDEDGAGDGAGDDGDRAAEAWLITAAARAAGSGRAAAVETLERGLQAHPGADALWLALARLRTGVERRDTLREGVRAAPGSPALLTVLARAEFDLGAPGAAAERYAEAFALAPGAAVDRAAASVALVDSQSDVDLALVHARFARRAAPDAAFGADALGQALFASGEVEAAEAELRLAVSRAGARDLAAHLHLSRLLAARGDATSASRAALRALSGALAAHQQREAEVLLRIAATDSRLETTLRGLGPEGPGEALGALILNETEEGLILDLAAIGLPEGVAMATLAPRPECAAPDLWAEAKSKGVVDRSLGLRLTDPADILDRIAGRGAANDPEEAMPDFRIAAGGIAAVTAKLPTRRISELRGRAIMLRPEGRPDVAPFACAIIP